MTTSKSWLVKQWRHPTFSRLIKNQKIVFLLLVIVVIHLVLAGINISLWKCPIKAVLGFRCPGCGLSQAILYLFQGKWRLAIDEHLFAPVFVMGFVIMTGVVMLPSQYHQRIVYKIEWIEKRTGFFHVIMGSLLIYWMIRMFLNTW
jgi:hypothetical protein